jgi:CO dehydrogenase maturation factor
MSIPAMPRVAPRAAGSPASWNGAGIRIVITGKGGVGKTTLTALLAHRFAREGRRVLAVDGDPQQNLAATLGVSQKEAGKIIPISQSAEYLREKTGAGPDVSPGGLLTLNPDVSDVIDRFSLWIDARLRLLVMGGVQRAGSGCLCPEYTLLAAILRHLRLLPEEVVLLDTAAGLEHFGRAVAEGFTGAVVVSDPSHNALSVARESATLARQLGIGEIILVVNRVHGDADFRKVREVMGDMGFSRTIFLPFDPEVSGSEPTVVPLLDRESAFMTGVKDITASISGNPVPQPPAN